MAVPYTFSTATSSIPLSQLDSNFATTITLGNTAIQLGNTVTTLNNMTLANVSISSGNVTFGNVTATTANVTTANVTTLEVYSYISLTESALTPTVGSFIYRPNSNAIAFGTANTERMRINSDGNVGIQNTGPSSYSAVNADNLVVGPNSGSNGITVVSGTTGTGNLAFADGIGTGGATDYAGLVQYDHNADNMNFFTGATERMRLNSSGLTLNGGTANGVAYLNGSKVLTTGSALTFDGTTLSVANGVTGGTSISLTGSYAGSGTVAFMNFQRVGGAVAGTLGYDDANNAIRFGTTTNHSTIFLQNNAEAMRLTSTGLGIGTSSPVNKLSVSNAGANGLEVAPAGTNSGTNILSINRSTSSFTTLNYYANDHRFYYGASNTEGLRLDSSGNLGLGVTPSAWSAFKAFELGAVGNSVWSPGSNDIRLATNYVYNGGSKYVTTGRAAMYEQAAGIHYWYTAASGTAGNAITFTQAMTLDASGNLNIGVTSTQGGRLSVVATASQPYESLDAPTAGYAYSALKYNGTAFGYMGQASAIVTGGANTDYALQATGNLLFATGGATERARITSGGDLLVGKTAVDAAVVGVQLLPSGGVTTTRSGSTNATSTMEVYSTGASAYRFYVSMDGTVAATNTTISAISDQRFKENVRDLDVGLNAIMALKPRKFDWKAGKGKDIKGDRGFIAQEFEQVFPDLIDEWKDPAPEGEEPYKAVRADLIPVLVKAMQEQQAMINELKAEVAALKAK